MDIKNAGYIFSEGNIQYGEFLHNVSIFES
jgi:hypothetical protein